MRGQTTLLSPILQVTGHALNTSVTLPLRLQRDDELNRQHFKTGQNISQWAPCQALTQTTLFVFKSLSLSLALTYSRTAKQES